MKHIGENLKKFRLLKNYSLKEAGALMNMSATAILKYENGELIPDSTKLIKFASSYGVLVKDILVSYEKVVLKFSSFRKNKTLTGQRLELLKKIIEDEISKYFLVLSLSGISNNDNKIKKYNISDLSDIDEMAIIFKEEVLKINQNSIISSLTNVIENSGILIINLKESDYFYDFDGYCEIVNNIPVIVISSKFDGATQRFILAHELAHLFINNCCKEEDEIICDKFANALLMPKKDVFQFFGVSRKDITPFELSIFKKQYKVSYKQILYRLKDLKIISIYTFKRILSEINKLDNEESFDKEISYQFKRIVYKLNSTNIIGESKAIELLGVSLDEYYKENIFL